MIIEQKSQARIAMVQLTDQSKQIAASNTFGIQDSIIKIFKEQQDVILNDPIS